jgi:putative DNA primase/helicase
MPPSDRRAKAVWPTAECVARALGKAKRNGKQWIAQCPAHDDRNPSLSIDNADDGRLLVNCHAGCDQARVIAVLRNRGLWPEVVDGPPRRQHKRANGYAGDDDDWQPIVPPPPDSPKPSAPQLRCDMLHEYFDTDDRLLCYVRRFESKDNKRKVFLPLTFGTLNGKPGWHNKAPDAPKPLYRLNALSHAAPDAIVLLCEGEKKADAAQRMFSDHVGMSWMGGAKADRHADLTPLAGRNVIIWPDADEPGRNVATRIANRLQPGALILDTSGLPDRFDAADLEREHPDDPEAWLAERLPPPRTLADSASRPVIKVEAGKLPGLATEGERALLLSGLPVFQRGRSLVRPIRQEVPAAGGRTTIAAGLRDLTVAMMIDLLGQAADWQVWNVRRRTLVATDPPPMVANIILSRAGFWSMPSIAGVTTTPTLRPDGSVLTAPGYDEATRLYHVPDTDLIMPPLGNRAPSRADAQQALTLLDGLLTGFPFVSATDRAVALSALITPVVRGAMTVAPLHAIRASTAGTGKSFLADLASMIATGRLCPVVAAGHTAEETEKRLVGLILGGFPLISIDNCNDELGGDLLCQAIERPLVRVRPLGRSEIVEVESRATLLATGNALRVRGDMTRRTLVCDLDANMERPETRSFTFDPVRRVRDDRGQYVAAALNVVRAYRHAGRPGRREPVASFAEWSDHVRCALVWLGHADPAGSMEAAREDDPELAELCEIIGLWRDCLGADIGLTAREIAERASRRLQGDQGQGTSEMQMPDLFDALTRIAGERGIINTKRLGKWLLAHEGRIVDGHRLKRGSLAHGGVVRWMLTRAGA